MTDHSNDFVRFTSVAEDRHSTVFPVAPPSREDPSNELIVGDVLSERIANPGVEAQDGFDTYAIGVRPQQIGPFVSPIVCVLGSFQERID